MAGRSKLTGPALGLKVKLARNSVDAFSAGAEAARSFARGNVAPDRSAFLAAFARWKKANVAGKPPAELLAKYTAGFRSAAPARWTERNPRSSRNFFGWLTEKKVTYRARIARPGGTRKAATRAGSGDAAAVAAEKARKKEAIDWQNELQHDFAYNVGAREKREGRGKLPIARLVLKSAIDVLGRQKATALATRGYNDGFRSGVALNPGRHGGPFGTPATLPPGGALFDRIRFGSRVTVVDRFNKKRTGKAVILGPHGWVLNMGGKHGTPAIADNRNVVAVAAPARRNPSQSEVAEMRALKARIMDELIAAAPTAAERLKLQTSKSTMAKWSDAKWLDYHGVKGKRNPESAAAELSETFHGKSADMMRLIIESISTHDELAELAELVQLVIYTPTGLEATLDFPLDDEQRTVFLTAASGKGPGEKKGNQLYFKGGDQEVPLSKLGMGGDWIRDQMLLGTLMKFTYRTRKKMHEFKLVDYWHVPGEESGARPVVTYDYRNKKLSLWGGRYHIDERGVID